MIKYEIITLNLVCREAKWETGTQNQQGEKKESKDFGHVMLVTLCLQFGALIIVLTHAHIYTSLDTLVYTILHCPLLVVLSFSWKYF